MTTSGNGAELKPELTAGGAPRQHPDAARRGYEGNRADGVRRPDEGHRTDARRAAEGQRRVHGGWGADGRRRGDEGRQADAAGSLIAASGGHSPHRATRPSRGASRGRAPLGAYRRSRGAAGLFALPLVLVVLAGCSSNTPVRPVGPPSSEARPTAAAPSGLVEQRRAAGIADCPTSDPDVPARDDGLPDLTLPCLDGEGEVRLAGLRGQPMLVNVWAQWCGPCRTEAPFLREAAERRPDVLVLGIDFDDPDPAAAISFADHAGWGWAHVADPDKAIAPALRVIGPPQSFLVDADGKIVQVHVGPFTSTAQLVDLLDSKLPR